jgi:hypothetical protein
VAEALSQAAKRKRAAERAQPPRRVPYGGRLLLAYAVVVVAFGGALIVLTVLATGGGHRGGHWSKWRPSGSDSEAAQQIADHVGRRYLTAAEGRQVMFATARFPAAFSRPITEIAVRDTAATGASAQTLPVESTDKALFYELCGLDGGTRCNLPGGVSPFEVSVRREAVELALYAFKYVHDVDTVVVFLPPIGKTNTAVFFRERNLKRELDTPLVRTLPVQPAPKLGAGDPEEADTVERLTGTHWFQARFQQGPVGSTILVLDPPILQDQSAVQP